MTKIEIVKEVSKSTGIEANTVMAVVEGFTEIEAALERGLRVLKFFPAEVLGGIAMLKALAGPYPQVQFVPTGGISASNLKSYLQQKNVLAVGGSWMVQSDLDEVRRLCQEAYRIKNT